MNDLTIQQAYNLNKNCNLCFIVKNGNVLVILDF